MTEARRCPNCGREMPAHAPQGLCPACLLGGILDHQEESQSPPGEPRSAAGTPGETAATADDISTHADPTHADDTAPPVFSESSGPSTDPAPIANFAPGDEGSVSSGTRIRYFGDYEILGELGSGAMGVVYKARQIGLNRLVALKMIRAGALAGEAELRRFQNEAEAVAGLDHPHIVPIHEVGEHDGRRYFSMKLIGGPCLSGTLSSYTANLQDAARLMVTIAEAVHHAHQRGILHRDLKPSNILLDEQGQPHVSDFGLAKQVKDDGSLTVSGAILGTPAYMAPEQAAGSKRLVTTLSDVYGLGAVLYTLLTGKPPFGGDSVMETLDRVRHQQPTPPSRLNRKVPRDLEVICLKCLDKDSQRRYPSAQALAAELTRFLGGEPIQARPVSAFEKGWRWCRRRPVIAGLSTALVVAVLGGLIGTSLGLLAALDARQDALNRERDAVKAQAAELLARGDAERESVRAKAQTELAEQRLYDSRMNLVQRNWEDYHGVLFQQGLEEQLPTNQHGIDRRGFEWFYWQRKISGLMTLKGHRGGVRFVAFSPDGTRLTSASGDGTVKVWDVATGREIRSLNGHNRVAFSLDGTRLACAGEDGMVKVWNVVTGQETLTLKGHSENVTSVAFSPGGDRLASASFDRTVKVWDARAGQEILALKGHTRQVSSVNFSPDGKWLVTAGTSETSKVWDAGNGEVRSDGGNGTLKVWDAGNGRETLTHIGNTPGTFILAFSPDGTRLASGDSSGMVKVWDPATGQGTLILKGHSSSIESASFSPDGTRLASGDSSGMAKVWDPANGREILTLQGHARDIRSLAFSPDGTRLASAAWDETVKVWDVGTGQNTLTLKGHTSGVSIVAFSPNGQRLASAGFDDVVIVWDARYGQEPFSLKGHGNCVRSVAFSPNGQRLAAEEDPGTVKVWDAASGQEILTLKSHTSPILSVKFLTITTRLATAVGMEQRKFGTPRTGSKYCPST